MHVCVLGGGGGECMFDGCVCVGRGGGWRVSACLMGVSASSVGGCSKARL